MQRKQFLKYLGVALGAAAVPPVLTACGGGDTAVSVPEPLPGSESAPVLLPALSAEEIAGLYYMREEEKLAHDVYLALFDRWDAQVFDNIAQSETQHTEAVRNLILAHGLEDPAASTAPGVFVNADLQALYNQLVDMGQRSLVDALKVGCLVEETDIRDIEERKAQVIDEPDIVQVYDNLLCGSRNHLRAFNSQLVKQEGVYKPTVLTPAEWDAIALSPNESCKG